MIKDVIDLRLECLQVAEQDESLLNTIINGILGFTEFQDKPSPCIVSSIHSKCHTLCQL